jgi:hypothetical protein
MVRHDDKLVEFRVREMVGYRTPGIRDNLAKAGRLKDAVSLEGADRDKVGARAPVVVARQAD